MVKQGDIILLSFDPGIGHEQCGKRPALVVSNNIYNSLGNLVLACPVTSKNKNFPYDVRLDNRTKTQGVILCRHLRSLDIEKRGYSVIESVPEDILAEVLDIVIGCLER